MSECPLKGTISKVDFILPTINCQGILFTFSGYSNLQLYRKRFARRQSLLTKVAELSSGTLSSYDGHCADWFQRFSLPNYTRLPPPKTNMEPQNWWFVDVSPFPRGYFQVPWLVFGRVHLKTNMEAERRRRFGIRAWKIIMFGFRWAKLSRL